MVIVRVDGSALALVGLGENCRPPPLTLIAVPLPKFLTLLMLMKPPLIVVAPVKLLVPVNVRIPVPVFVIAPVPVMVPA